jgi:signal transduction histidine kinase
MNAPVSIPLRRWLTAALLCIAVLPPLAVWAVHAVSAVTTGPSASELTAARAYAISNVGRWTDPVWQAGARAYFAAQQTDTELRPARGPWFSTLAVPAAVGAVPPGDKFVVSAPGSPPAVGGSGWVIPRTGTRTGWALPLTAGFFTLALMVAATGIFLGRHVVRPLAAISRAAPAIPYGEAGLRLPATRVGEVAAVAAALQSMSGNLRAALDQQADMEEQRRQFIGAIAHDLRTPLFTLRAYLDGLNDGLATSPQKTSQYLQACRTSANALDRLVTDLFSYARMEFLGEQPRRGPVDLAVLLRTAAQAHRLRADARQITLTVTAPAGPCTVSADEHLLARVIGNLLDNALRHTPEQGHIDLHCQRTGDEAVFTVADSGPGIAAADLPHLFTPLYRGETSRSRATGGSGLGLAIAHRILLAHGGTLTAGNVTPHGASFTARLPAVAPSAGQPTAAGPPPAPGSPGA